MITKHLDSLNDAQKKAVLHHEGPLLILAGAGAGKTRVIVHRIAELIRSGVAPERILAVTFTNKAAREMKERVTKLLREDLSLSPYDIPKTEPFVGTFHGLSLSIIKTFHKKMGILARFTIMDRGDSIRVLREAIKSAGFDPKQLEPSRVLSVMSRHKGSAVGLEEFKNSYTSSYIDEAIGEVWEKYQTTLKKEKALDFDDILLTAHTLLETNADARNYFQRAWTHVHVDEYQDVNRVQYEIVKMLASEHGNIAAVGDSDQCLIGGTQITMNDGSKKPIEKVRVGDMVLSNFGSGDLRASRVTQAHQRLHRGELITITTQNGKTLTSTPEHIHFAGYRLGLTPQLHFTYLMHKSSVGWRLGVSQTYTRGQRNPIIGFLLRCNQEHADDVWIVGTHDTAQEARIHEYMLSLRYGIPTIPFVARKGLSTNGYVHDQKSLDSIFRSFDTETAAHRLLADRRLSLEHPHHRAQPRNSNRRNITLTLCGDRRGKSPMHRISMVGNDAEGKRGLKTLGLSVRSARQDSKSWRFETANKKYGALLEVATRIQHTLPNTVLIENARLGGKKKRLKDGNSLRMMPAASLLPGMAVFNEKGGYDVIERVTYMPNVKTRVYDLDIAQTHNFIANDIKTHNCIYSWRGASIEHILNFEHDFPRAETVLLIENYRSTQNIIAAANDAIAKNVRRKEKELVTHNKEGEKIAVAGFSEENSEAAFVATEAKRLIQAGASPDDIAVLYRANFQSRVLEEAFLAADVPYQVLGTRFFERKEVKDTLSYLKAALSEDSVSDFVRAIGAQSRGIGKVTLAKVIAGHEAHLPEGQRKKIADFRALLFRIKQKTEREKTSDTVRYVINESGMWNMYEKGGTEDTERLENLKELVTVASKYDSFAPPEGIEKLLEESALQSDQDELDMSARAKKHGVKLMTVHAAKGLEFETIFITGLEDGLFPHEKKDSDRVDDEEERRLFYVALTRAKEKAYLTYAASRLIFGTRVLNTASEFITELDSSLVEIVASPILWGTPAEHEDREIL